MNKKMKVVIVDDEQSARNILEKLLMGSLHGKNLNIIAKCENLIEASEVIKKHNPDIVFLDIRMPQYDGLSINKIIPTINFHLVFITAYHEYAVKAFELNAIDYILKPINRQRLEQTLDKLLNSFSKKNKLIELEKIIAEIDKTEQKFPYKDINGLRLIPYDDIIAFQAQSSYCLVHLKNGESLLGSKNLKFYSSQIKQPNAFFKAHKAWLINITHIKEIEAKSNNILLKNDIIAKCSKINLQNLKQLVVSSTNKKE